MAEGGYHITPKGRFVYELMQTLRDNGLPMLKAMKIALAEANARDWPSDDDKLTVAAERRTP